MKTRILLSFTLALLASLSFGQNFSRAVAPYVTNQEKAVAITNVKVIDGTGGPAKNNQTVIFIDGVITQIGSTASMTYPSDYKSIDGTSKT